jgi:NAD-specific glutamate dehydrogenase
VLRSALGHRGDTPPDEALAAWLDGRRANIARAQHALDEMQRAGAMDFPTISVALSEITRLVETHYAD